MTVASGDYDVDQDYAHSQFAITHIVSASTIAVGLPVRDNLEILPSISTIPLVNPIYVSSSSNSGFVSSVTKVMLSEIALVSCSLTDVILATS